MTSQENLVSVIVPCYNYAQYLPEALDSVLAQTYKNWECIIVNDGSPDNTEEVAFEYCKKDSRFKYLYKENGGHSSARNFGIMNSNGKYILPLDPDDKIAACFLEKAVPVLNNDKNVKIVCLQTQVFGDSDQIIKMPGSDLRSLLIVNYLVNTCMYRKSEFEQTNKYDESMLGFEDWNLWISLLKEGGKVVELPFIGYFYRKKELSVFNNFLKDKKRVFQDQLRLYNNHVDIYKKYFDSPIHLIQENEKMNRVISAYQKSNTYKLGLLVRKIKSPFLSLLRTK